MAPASRPQNLQEMSRAVCADRAELRALGITPEMLKGATIMKGTGCNNCNNTGNRGRFGVFEIFVIDDEARKLIYDRQPDFGLAGAGRARWACGPCAKTASARF